MVVVSGRECFHAELAQTEVATVYVSVCWAGTGSQYQGRVLFSTSPPSFSNFSSVWSWTLNLLKKSYDNSFTNPKKALSPACSEAEFSSALTN